MSSNPLRDFAHESCILASLIEGLDALHHTGDGHEDCPIAKRARNAMPPMIEIVIEKAWALNEQIESAYMARLQKPGAGQ